MRYLIFDTETTGFIIDGQPPEHPQQPWLLQLGWVVAEGDYAETIVEEREELLYHKGLVEVPASAARVHGIGVEKLKAEGRDPLTVLKEFNERVLTADIVTAFNLAYDEIVALAAYHRVGGTGRALRTAKRRCVMQSATEACAIPKPGTTRAQRRFKYPSLKHAYELLVDKKGFSNAHTALADARATVAVLQALLRTETELIYDPPALLPLVAATGAAGVAIPAVSAVPELTELDAILSAAVDFDGLTDWEADFVKDFVEKRERYGAATRVSPKQLDVLHRIRDKIDSKMDRR